MSTLSAYAAQQGTYEFYKMQLLRKSMLLLGSAVGVATVTCALLASAGIILPNLVIIVGAIVLMGLGMWVNTMGDTPASYAVVIGSGVILGAMASPVIYMMFLNGMSTVVWQALIATFLLFTLMGALSVFTNIDFTRLAPFLSVSFLLLFIVSLLNAFFFKSSFVSLLLSYGIAVISCGLIGLRLNIALQGGNMTPAQLALGLLVDLYNLFMSLLRILSSNRD